MVAAAQVFAEQAKGAGVTVKVKKVDAGVFYGDDYLQVDLRPGLLGHAQLPAADHAHHLARRRPYNETHWKDAEWQAIVDEAFKTVDDAKRNELVAAGRDDRVRRAAAYIVWQFNILLDAYSKKLGGVIPDTWGQSACKNRYNLMYLKS